MRWFKHLSQAAEDEELSEILELHGPEGYGIYWIILEKIAFLMDGTDKTSARYSIKKWAKFCGKSPKVFRKFLESFERLNLLKSITIEENNQKFLKDFGIFIEISCPNLLKYRDEYSKKSRQTPDNIPPEYGETPDQDRESESESESDKTKELFAKAFEAWWITYPKRNDRRIGKKEAKKKFLKLKQDQWNDLKTATENYSSSLKESGLSPSDAHRFLNETWLEYVKQAGKSQDDGKALTDKLNEETKSTIKNSNEIL